MAILSQRQLQVSKVKDELVQVIQRHPENSSHEEIVHELAFHIMVQRGLTDADSGRIIRNEEMGRRIRTWRELAHIQREKGQQA